MSISAWFKQMPGRAWLWALWLLLMFLAAGLLGAFLAWGPADSDSAVLIAGCGVLLGGLHASLWLRQKRLALAGQGELARRWRRGLLTGNGVILVGMAAAVLLSLLQSGFFPPLNPSRTAAFERLAAAVERSYPYFEEKGLDWAEITARYRPRIAAAENDAAYFDLIARMLAELGDGHSGLQTPYLAPSCCFAVVREVEGLAVVIRPGAAAEKIGMRPGAVILEVAGQPVEAALAAGLPYSGTSSPQQTRLEQFATLLYIPQNGKLAVTFRNPDGEQIRGTIVYEAPQGGQSAPVVEWRRLESGLGYIRLSRFWLREGEDLMADFDRAVDELMDAPGIILDVRGNGGGDSRLSDAAAGRFFEQRFVYGTESYRQRLALRGFRSRMTYRVLPRGAVYRGPLALLMDSGCASTTEMFIAALGDSGRARTFGRVSAGSSGNPVPFRLPGGGEARFSTGAFQRSGGELIEGAGIQPDEAVAWRLADVIEGRDPDLAAAEAWLLSQP